MVVRTDDRGIAVMYLEMDASRVDTLHWIIGRLLGDTPAETDVPIARIIPLPVVGLAEGPINVSQVSLLRA